MPTKLKTLLTMCLMGLLVFSLAPAESFAKQKTLRIGVVAPLTGPSARAGKEHKGACEMAFEDVGYKIGDYDVELIWIDSEGDPEKASRAYEKAVLREKIDAGLLNWHSSVASALMEISARSKVPHYFALGASGIVNQKYHSNPERYSYWIGKGWASPSKLTAAYINTIQDAIDDGLLKLPNKKVVIYGEDTDWGRSYGKGIADRFKEAGWDIVFETFFSAQETDLLPLISKMKNSGASIVAGTVSNPPTQAAFIKQAREVGLKSLLIVDALGETGDWYALTKSASDYVLDNRPIWSTEKGKAFAEKFEKKYGFAPGPAASGLAHDFTGFFIKCANEAFKQYGKLDRKVLYKFGKENVYTGKISYTGGLLMKEYKYTPETFPDPIVGGEYFTFPVIQYMNGKGNIIWPAAFKTADMQAPDYLK